MPDAENKGQDFKILQSALGGEWVAGEKIGSFQYSEILESLGMCAVSIYII